LLFTILSNKQGKKTPENGYFSTATSRYSIEDDDKRVAVFLVMKDYRIM
jgi:hypothetical protein